MPLKNSQYDIISREYNSKQYKNKRDFDKRILEIYEKIPEIKEIDEKIASNSVLEAKRILFDEIDSLDDLNHENKLLSKRKSDLLLLNNYPINFLQPRYHCSDCKDTGYINNKKCHCFKQAIVDFVYSQSNIKSILEKENFNNFSLDYYPKTFIDKNLQISAYDNIKRVVSIVKNFINTFDSSYNNLLLYGNTGVGKTFLSNCIAKELLDKAYTVIYLTSFQLFDILEKNKFNKWDEDENISEQFDYILDCDLLILDDLGTELNNSFIISQLFLCINERYLRQKSTIISTNLSLANLNEQYTERIFSRISSNYTMLKIFGNDIRLLKVFS